MIKLSDQNKKDIEQAIADLELKTSGEIIVYIAKSSHAYLQGLWIPTTLSCIISLLTIYTLSHFWLLPKNFGINEVIIITLGIITLTSTLFSFVKPLRLLFTKRNDIEEEVLQKAQSIFIEEDIFNTIDRTGILIFISQLERKVIILGDKGINAKITQSDWDNILQLVVTGVKTKAITPRLIEAIKLCEKLLLDNGFNVRKDDVNELSNHVRIEE